MNIQVNPTSSNLASAMLNSNIRPRAVVGYGVKNFHPSPPNYVTRSPGCNWLYCSNVVNRPGGRHTLLLPSWHPRQWKQWHYVIFYPRWQFSFCRKFCCSFSIFPDHYVQSPLVKIPLYRHPLGFWLVLFTVWLFCGESWSGRHLITRAARFLLATEVIIRT